jgi:hypothetical protein
MTCQETDSEKVTCDQCGLEVCQKHIQCHQQTAKCKELQKQYTPPATVATIPTTTPEPAIDQAEPDFYCISVNGHDPKDCPVYNCPYQTNQPKNMREHFRNHHIKDTVVIAEEGQLS